MSLQLENLVSCTNKAVIQCPNCKGSIFNSWWPGLCCCSSWLGLFSVLDWYMIPSGLGNWIQHGFRGPLSLLCGNQMQCFFLSARRSSDVKGWGKCDWQQTLGWEFYFSTHFLALKKSFDIAKGITLYVVYPDWSRCNGLIHCMHSSENKAESLLRINEIFTLVK